jgi:hypothetical protein
MANTQPPKEALRSLLAAALNTAQHNIYLVMEAIVSDIMPKLSTKKSQPQSQSQSQVASVNPSNTDKFGILDMFLGKKDPDQNLTIDQQQIVLKAFLRHFAFLRPFASTDTLQTDATTPIYRTVGTLLEQALKRVAEERNLYSHYHTSPSNSVEPLHLPDSREDQLSKIFITHFERYFNATTPRAKRQVASRYPNVTKESCEGFKGNAIKDKTFQPTAIGYYTPEGVLALACLFLSRKQANALLRAYDQICPQPYTEQAPAARNAHYTHWCARLPQPRLESGDLALDILNEISRCPEQLYDWLSENARLEILNLGVEANTQRANNDPEETDSTEDSPDHLPKRNRDSERFQHLALRYLDEMNLLPALKFQLHVGNLVVHKKQKKRLERNAQGILEDREGDRFMLKPLHVFGSLSDFNKKRQDGTLPPSWKIVEQHTEEGEINPETAESGNIVQCSPRYHIKGFHVGIKFEAVPLPEIKQINEKGYFYARYDENMEEHIKKATPDAILDVAALPALCFYTYLYHQGGKDKGMVAPEKLMQEFIETFKRFCEDVKSGEVKPVKLDPRFKKMQVRTKQVREARMNGKTLENFYPYQQEQFDDLQERKQHLRTITLKDYEYLTPEMLPDNLREYLLGFEKSYRKAVLSFFDNQKADVKERLRQVKKWEENPDEATFALKQGQIASWLVNDIKNYIRPTPQGKHLLNDEKFNRLQNLLAYYRKDEVVGHFKEYGIVQPTHPFITAPVSNNLFEYYKGYLGRKKIYLETAYKKVEGNYDKATKKFSGAMSESAIEKTYGYLFGFKSKDFSEAYERNAPAVISIGQWLFEPIILAHLKEKEKVSLVGTKARPTLSYGLLRYLQKTEENGNDRIHVAPAYYDFTRYPRQYETYLESRGMTLPEYDTIRPLVEGLSVKEYEAKPFWEKLNYLKTSAAAQTESIKKNLVKEIGNIKRIRQLISDGEKEISRFVHQDRCLWLMAKHYLAQRTANEMASGKQNVQSFAAYHISNYYDLLNHQETVSVAIEGKNNQGEKVTIGKVSARIKFKDYGNLRRFAKDLRLPSVIRYLKPSGNAAPSYDKELLTRALDCYEQERNKVFSYFYQVEKAVEVCNPSFYNANLEEKEYIPHTKYIDEAYRLLCITEFSTLYGKWTAKEIKDLRNKLLHNELYYREDLKVYIQNNLSPYNDPNEYGRQVILAYFKIVADIYSKLSGELGKISKII